MAGIRELAATIRTDIRMRNKYLIILILLLSSKLIGQTIEQNIDHYLTGEIYSKGQMYCDTINGYKTCSSIGLWTYWYRNGQKMLETFSTNTSTKYINMWLPSGQQILTGGNGTYYNGEPHGAGDCDSLVYQITDSIQNGPFKRYRLYKGSSYFLVETGQYANNRKVGKFYFRDTVQYLIEEETVYNNDEEVSSHYKYLHKNSRVKQEGNTKRGFKEGLCKFYNEKGTVIKEVNYKDGTEFGEYKEYYANGKIKIQGQYIHTKGYVEASSIDPDGNEHISKVPSDKIPTKHGEWKYFDINGKLTKTKKHVGAQNGSH